MESGSPYEVLLHAVSVMPWRVDRVDALLVEYAGLALDRRVTIEVEPVPGAVVCAAYDTGYLIANAGPPMTVEQGHVIEALVTVASTSRKVALREQRLMYKTRVDDLTGLWQGGYFRQLVARAQEDRAPGEQIGLLFCDLDRFREINANLGHLDADRVLAEVGRRLMTELPNETFPSRLGGDEFGIMLRRASGEGELETLATLVKRVVAEPISVGDHFLSVQVSIGSSYSTGHDDDLERFFRSAEERMRLAKAEGREPTQAPTWIRESATTLDRLIDRQEIEVELQPIFDTATCQLVGYEALVRGGSEELGSLPPGLLVTAATRRRLLGDLTELVAQQAVTAVGDLAEKLGRKLILSINIELEQLRPGSRSIAAIRDLIADRPVAVVLEITERQVQRWGTSQQLAAIELEGAGIELAMDDFGAGFSTIGLLKAWGWGWVKLDRSLIPVKGDERNTTLFGHVVQMVHDFGFFTVADGIETAEQLELARSLGVQFVQGFHLGRPCPISDLAD